MGTTTKIRYRPIAVLKLPKHKAPLLVAYALSIVRAMTDNPHFPSPNPRLATVEAAIDALAAAQTATLTRAVWTRPVRDEKRLALEIVLKQLCAYVQTTADANSAQAVSIIESSGMSVKKVRVYPARLFAAKRWRVSGSVKLLAPKAAGKSVAYEWGYSIAGMKTWVLLPVTVQASTIVDGLQPGSTVVFRYRITTKRGTGDWSDPVSIIVD